MVEGSIRDDVEEWWDFNSTIIRKAAEEVLDKTSSMGIPENQETWLGSNELR